MVGLALAVLLAFCAAVCMAIGIVVRQRATLDIPPEKGVSTVMFRTLVRRRLWWAGTGVAVAGYGFQAGALAYGSLILVQPILVSALLFALPMSARLAGRRVSRGEWAWAVVLTFALTVFVALARATNPGDYRASLPRALISVAVCSAGVAGCVVLSMRAAGWVRAALLGGGVGVLFGVVAVLTKVWVHQLHDGLTLGNAVGPVLLLLVALGVLATLLQQSAFHAGSLQMSVPIMLVLEPVVAVALGAVVLGEHLSVSGIEPLLLVAAVVAMGAATIALGRHEGAYEEQLEQQAAAAERRTGHPAARG